MNKRKVAYTVAVALVAVIALLMWLLIRSSPLPDEAPVTVQPGPASNPSAPPSVTQFTPTGRQIPGGPPEPSDPRWKEREIKRQIDPNYEWKMPINFYGRVVDENKQSVPSATIVSQWSDLSTNGASSETTLSDQEGFFSITGKTGHGITIRVSKDGYYAPKQQQISFDYVSFWESNYHDPNANNPVLFHLRKKNKGETLSSAELRPTLPANGVSVRFDLLNGGRISPEGQLEIAAVTNTEQYPPRIFDWRATISVGGGGLIEHNSEFPFEAPEGGISRALRLTCLQTRRTGNGYSRKPTSLSLASRQSMGAFNFGLTEQAKRPP